MRESPLSSMECRPVPTTRSAEKREKAIQSLALRSLGLVQKAHEDAWPCRIPPLAPTPDKNARLR